MQDNLSCLFEQRSSKSQSSTVPIMQTDLQHTQSDSFCDILKKIWEPLNSNKCRTCLLLLDCQSKNEHITS